MLKFISSQLSKYQIKSIAKIAFLYCILFNTPIILFKFDYYKADVVRGLLDLSKNFFYIFCANFIFFFGLAINRYLMIFGSLFLFVTGAISSYAVFFFKIFPNSHIIRAFFENEFSETIEVVSVKLILWIIFAVVLCIKFIPKSTFNKLPTIIAFVIFIIAIISPPYRVLSEYFPIKYLHNSYLYLFNKSITKEKKNPFSGVQFIDKSKNDTVGVLVIGESARYDHFSINGYYRDTSPLISKIKNLFSFKANADANITYLSVPYMLSNLPKNMINEAIYNNSFLSILTGIGINTNWIGTQSLIKYLAGYVDETIYDEVNIAIIPGGSALFEMNDLDAVMLPYLDNFLSKKGKKFIVIHTSGSHWNYYARYSKDYEKFSPICASDSKVKSDMTSCSKEELINIYDNSILYTDYIISEIIKRLSDKNAFLIYASDHGESLGENGRYGHGDTITEEQTSIPFIFWASNGFISDHPSLIDSIDKKRNDILSHNYIFHSSLGCMGIESKIIKEELNLCHHK